MIIRRGSEPTGCVGDQGRVADGGCPRLGSIVVKRDDDERSIRGSAKASDMRVKRSPLNTAYRVEVVAKTRGPGNAAGRIDLAEDWNGTGGARYVHAAVLS